MTKKHVDIELRVHLTLGYIPGNWSTDGPDKHRIICGHDISEVPRFACAWEADTERISPLPGSGWATWVDLDDPTSLVWRGLEKVSESLTKEKTRATSTAFVSCWMATMHGVSGLPYGTELTESECGEFLNEDRRHNGRFYFRIMTENLDNAEIDIDDVYLIRGY